ncbi:MAG TPA: TRAP transporter large permease [Firmicutes bacterium]|nr:C4-dicarboxylate transporter, DctM subunit [Bacillota bacterium]HHV58515.1 TRAP transporter large permease [Bacillota bacterium]
MIIGILLLVLLSLFVVNMPIAFGIIGAVAVALTVKGIPFSVILQRMIAATESFPLMAIPFFLLAGSLMNSGGITKRLVRFAQTLVGHVTGGLAQVSVVTNMIMAGISGSAVADASGTGAILVPTMVEAGFDKRFAAAVVGAAATIGPVIPPSISFVLYGSLTGTSVGKLFLAGAIPGIMVGLYLMVTCYVIAQRRNYPRERRATFSEVVSSFRDSVLALIMPLIILGGVLGGAFTPTEAAAVAVAYAFVVGVFVYKELTIRDLYRVTLEATVSTAAIMLIIAAASPLGWVLAWERVPQMIADAFTAFTSSQWVVYLVINILLLIFGCFVEANATMILLIPVLFPLIQKVGIDPVQFGVVATLNLMIGTITPPFGVSMFVMSKIAGISIAEFTRAALPFIVVLILALLVITYIPSIVLWLPSLLG